MRPTTTLTLTGMPVPCTDGPSVPHQAQQLAQPMVREPEPIGAGLRQSSEPGGGAGLGYALFGLLIGGGFAFLVTRVHKMDSFISTLGLP